MLFQGSPSSVHNSLMIWMWRRYIQCHVYILSEWYMYFEICDTQETWLVYICLQIKGLPEALLDPNSMVSTNYSALYAPKTFENMRRFRGGHALFTFPTLPIKCPGAPQKIMYMADDYWRKVLIPSEMRTLLYTSLGPNSIEACT